MVQSGHSLRNPKGIRSYLDDGDVIGYPPEYDDPSVTSDASAFQYGASPDTAVDPTGITGQGSLGIQDVPGYIPHASGTPPLLARPFGGQTDYFDPDNPPPAPPAPHPLPVTNVAPPLRTRTTSPESDELLGQYIQDVRRLKDMTMAQPVMSSPKWWQRALAAGFGAGAGWSNAASRTRTPIDIGAVQGDILHPGYSSKLAEWQSRIAPMQRAAEMEGQVFAAQERAEQIRSLAEQRKAQAQLREAQASPHYQQEQLDPVWARKNVPWLRPDEKGEYWIDKATAKELQTEANKTIIVPQHAQAIRGGQVIAGNEERPKTIAEAYEEAKRVPGMPDKEAWQYALEVGSGGKYTSPPRQPDYYNMAPGAALVRPLGDNNTEVLYTNPNKPIDPLVEANRQAVMDERDRKAAESTQKVLDDISKQKIDEWAKRDMERDAEIKRIFPGSSEQDIWDTHDPQAIADLKAINRRFAPLYQAIQDNYYNAGTARGIRMDRIVIDPNTLQATKVPDRQNASPTPAPPATPPPAGPGRGPGRGAAPGRGGGANLEGLQIPGPGQGPIILPPQPPAPQKAAAAPEKYTEAEVRAAAVKAHKDPNAAVNLARKRGVLK